MKTHLALRLLPAALVLLTACGSPTDPNNHAPVITKMEGPTSTTVGVLVVYSCFAEDEDGDQLYWSWNRSDSHNSKATLTFQVARTITIACTVEDHRGGSDTESIDVEVRPLPGM